NELRRLLLRSNLLSKAQVLEGFAYSTPQRNRVFGGPGHNATVNYLYDQTTSLGGYYNVEFQPFVELYTAGNATVKVNGADQGAQLFTYSPSGTFSEPLVAVANLGCNAVRFPCPLCLCDRCA
ncbi:MAG: hypothetical protein Q9225_005899, partial [Loekoesia sp. 1 TL-2023]